VSWGVPRRPKISNKLGIPNPREGSDGDIQVRQTGIGARIFAKIGGRWLSNKLYGNELDSPDVFMPKCWVGEIKPPATQVDTSVNAHVYLPEYIHQDNFLGVTARLQFLNLTNGESCVWKWGDSGTNSPNVNHAPNVEMTLRYYPDFNRISLLGLDVTTAGLYSGSNAVIHDSDDDSLATIFVTVFFK